MTGRQVMTGRCVESVEPLYNWGRLARIGAEPTPPLRYRQKRGENIERPKPERRDA